MSETHGERIDPAIAPFVDALLIAENRSILLALAAHPSTLRELAAACGRPEAAVREVLQPLEQSGFVRRSSDRFTLTDLVRIRRDEQGGINMRASNKEGDFLQVRIRDHGPT